MLFPCNDGLPSTPTLPRDFEQLLPRRVPSVPSAASHHPAAFCNQVQRYYSFSSAFDRKIITHSLQKWKREFANDIIDTRQAAGNTARSHGCLFPRPCESPLPSGRASFCSIRAIIVRNCTRLLLLYTFTPLEMTSTDELQPVGAQQPCRIGCGRHHLIRRIVAQPEPLAEQRRQQIGAYKGIAKILPRGMP